MSLPAGFLDELRGRLSLGQVVGRKVMWDQRKSNQGKGDLWAPCPFHQEKTASFHVDDRKGYYYCFGCHAKGDAINFVRETENVDFMEAVKILAAEAGMPMPERDPQAQEKADARTQLFEVMEQAVRFYRLQLQTAAAADARDYLLRRGLNEAAQDRWEIGFAPGSGGVLAHLTGKGVDAKLVVDAGLAAQSDRGSGLYDRFRGRIMFPIRDARGRVIGFGGRAMDPNHPAKYYNSPETALFDKGRSLFNHGPARAAAGKGQPLIVAEGYMDVIALVEAGFGATVAPLGTAITEDQLQLLWRMADEPIIALDGDTAGLRAAMRLIDIALPLLEAGKSLRFALMPEGLDPDDVIKQQGAAAMRQLVENALPMVQLLWRRETEGKVFDSPERKAALDKTLREQLQVIRDPNLRGHYEQTIKDLKWALFRPKRASTGNFQRNTRKGEAAGVAKHSALAVGATDEVTLREVVILATLLATPEVGVEFETALARLICSGPEHDMLRHLILQNLGQPDLQERIVAAIGPAPLEKLFKHTHVAISPSVRRRGDVEVARLTLAEAFARLQALRGHAREVAEAVEDLEGIADEGVTWRLAQASEALQNTRRGDGEDDADFALSENGALIKKEEKNAFAKLLGQINFAKKSPGTKS